MKERCRFCYKAIETEFCKNIFNNKQTNPSICKIVEMLTNLTIVESDPYTKLTCMDCFDVLILFYHFRESVLQTNQLLINNKINNTNNNNNLNVSNKWPGIVRDNNGRFIIDIRLHRESDSAAEDRMINGNNQDSNQYNEQSIEKNKHDVVSLIKEEIDIEETCVKIENDSLGENRKIDENYYHLSVPAGDDSNETICSDNKIIDNGDSYKHCSDITEGGSDVKEFTCIIDNYADCNEDSSQTVDSGNSDKVNDIEVVYVQDYNEIHLEPTNVECQNNGNSNQRKNNEKHSKQPYQCNICDKRFSVNAILKRHLLTHTGEKLHHCNICDKKFRQKVHLKQHLLLHTGEKPHQCNICDKTFTLNTDLRRHVLTHTGEKPHQCNICDKKFRQKVHLKQHSFSHTNERPHHCKICDKTFTLNTDLRRHSLTHSTEKPYQCNICDKKFTLKAYLKQHSIVHIGDKPYQCNVCNERFTRKGHLKQHLSLHTGERPHPCNICEKTFILNGDLKKHLLTHTSEKPYQCNICDRKFTLKQQLNNHLSTHTDERPYQCDICDDKFKRKQHLKSHILRHIGEKFKRTTKV